MTGLGRAPLAGAVACLLVAAACAHGPGPAQEISSPRPLVVLVPGITGSILSDATTGRVAWGKSRSIFWPAAGGHLLALPLGGGDAPPLTATGVVERIRWGPLRRSVYRGLLRRLEAAGWRRVGTDDGDLLPFAYDWRRDNRLAVEALASRLQELARSRAEPLDTVLLCHSNGASLCRYLVRHGGGEPTGQGLPPQIRVRAMVLLGPSVGGSVRLLELLHEGRRYLPLLGRRFRPEVLFTFPALFQELPAPGTTTAVELSGRPAQVDPWRVESWVEGGWSVFRPRVADRADARPETYGGAAERRRHLQRRLADGRRFHEELVADAPGLGMPPIHVFLSTHRPTPVGFAVTPEGAPVFSGDRRARRAGLAEELLAPGDGHTPLSALETLSPAERRQVVDGVREVPGGHRGVLDEPAVQDAVLEILADVASDL